MSPPPRVDVVICLSTTVKNDTLQEAKEQRVALKCRKQLRVEELEMVKTPSCLQSLGLNAAPSWEVTAASDSPSRKMRCFFVIVAAKYP